MEGIERRHAMSSLHPDAIKLEQSEAVDAAGRLVGYQDVDPVELARALDAGGKVHSVAERRIFEALLGAEIADTGDPGMDADADADRRVREPPGGIDELQCGEAGIARMLGVVEGSVPECHHPVADIFVDGAAMAHHGCRGGRVDAADERYDLLRRSRLGQSGEIPDVREEDRQRAKLAAQHDPFRRFDELLDDGRCHESAEYAAHGGTAP